MKGILGCVGTRENEGQTWLTPDGRWQHGLLRGAWRKPDAEYLGHNSREEARRRRIAELEAVLATIEESIARLARERKAIEVRAARIASERASAPGVGRLQRAAHELESAESASAEARQRLDEIDQLLSKAIEAERETRDARDRDAADLDLTPWKEPSALAKLELLLTDVRVKAAALWPAWHALLGARFALGNATDRETESQVSLDVAAGRVEEARKLAAAANAHFETLHSSVGATVNEVLHRLSAVRDELERLAETEKNARTRVSDLKIQKAVIARDEQRAETDLAVHEAARDEAVGRLRLFAEKRLLEEAAENLQPEKVDLAANPAVELARRIEQTLASVLADEEAWKRVQSGVQQQYGELNDQLGMRGYHPIALPTLL